VLPELDALADLVEDSDWHQDSVLDQSLRLAHWVQRLPEVLPPAVDLPPVLARALWAGIAARRYDGYTVQSLLTFAALIHDLGKAETFRRLPDGKTRCPGHEVVSARLALTLCARFEFGPSARRFVIRVVAAHGEPYALFKRTASLPEAERRAQMQDLGAECGDDLSPLLLLALGDLVTSQLEARQPSKYEAVRAFYRAWLRDLGSSAVAPDG
jgi:hypothetical protein